MKRNTNIDLLKIILAFFVIAIHIFSVRGIEGMTGIIYREIANGITRIAVPLFFIISGFFLSEHLNDRSYIRTYLRRILLLFLIRQGIYLPFSIIDLTSGIINISDFLRTMIYGYVHLRYLIATVGAGILLYLSRNIQIKTKRILALLLLILGYAIQIVYSKSARYIDMGTTRNFLFFAFPYMLIGSMYTIWSQYLSKKIRISIILGLLLLIESRIYRKIGIPVMDHYLIVIPLSMFLFSRIKEKKSQFPYIINKNISLGIYLVHLLILFLGNGIPSFPMRYVVVCIGSILAWWILEKINKKFPYLF